MSKITDFVNAANNLLDPPRDEIDFGGINPRLSTRIAEETGTRVLRDARTILTSSGVRHAFARHNADTELGRPQIPITPEDFDLLFDITRNPDKIEKGDRQGRKRDDIIIFSKRIGAKTYYVLMNADRGKEPATLYFNTMYIRK